MTENELRELYPEVFDTIDKRIDAIALAYVGTADEAIKEVSEEYSDEGMAIVVGYLTKQFAVAVNKALMEL